MWETIWDLPTRAAGLALILIMSALIIGAAFETKRKSWGTWGLCVLLLITLMITLFLIITGHDMSTVFGILRGE